MLRNVTALYRSHVTTVLLRGELGALGVSQDAIRVVPDTPRALDFSEFGAAETQVENLRTLDLPEQDLLDYEERILNGDYLVSVAVEDDLTAQVEETMRRPEDFAHMHERFGPGSDVEDAAPNMRDIDIDSAPRRSAAEPDVTGEAAAVPGRDIFSRTREGDPASPAPRTMSDYP